MLQPLCREHLLSPALLLQHLNLDAVLRHQAIHNHVSRLADAVTPVLCLQVAVRVPVAVEYDARVGRSEVDAQPTRPRGQQEAEHVWVRIELLDASLAIFHLHSAVESPLREPHRMQEVVQDVQQARHLREDQHLVALLTEDRQHAAQQLELARGQAQQVREGLADELARLWVLRLPEEKWMVAHLAQVHVHVDLRNGGRALDAHLQQRVPQGSI